MQYTADNLKAAENLVLIVNGGIGRNIMATAVVRNLKRAYPDKRIVVICGTPDLFLRNPHVHRVYHLGNTLYFYEDFVQHSKTIVLDVEPYRHFDYLQKRRHFVDLWCEMIGVPCDDIYPEFFLTDAERKLAEAWVNQYDRPLVLCQFEGGKTPDTPSEKDRLIARNAMYRRWITEAVQQRIVDTLVERNYKVGIVAHENQWKPLHAEPIFFPTRAVVALLEHAVEIVCIDSFLMHAAAAFKKRALVLWAGTSPTVLGYDCHHNLRREVCETPECHRPNSYLFDLEATGFQWECPWSNRCTEYEPDTVLAALDELTGGRRGTLKNAQPVRLAADGINPYAAPCAGSNGAGGQAAGTRRTEGSPESQVPTGHRADRAS